MWAPKSPHELFLWNIGLHFCWSINAYPICDKTVTPPLPFMMWFLFCVMLLPQALEQVFWPTLALLPGLSQSSPSKVAPWPWPPYQQRPWPSTTLFKICRLHFLNQKAPAVPGDTEWGDDNLVRGEQVGSVAKPALNPAGEKKRQIQHAPTGSLKNCISKIIPKPSCEGVYLDLLVPPL